MFLSFFYAFIISVRLSLLTCPSLLHLLSCIPLYSSSSVFLLTFAFITGFPLIHTYLTSFLLVFLPFYLPNYLPTYTCNHLVDLPASLIAFLHIYLITSNLLSCCYLSPYLAAPAPPSPAQLPCRSLPRDDSHPVRCCVMSLVMVQIPCLGIELPRAGLWLRLVM